MTTPAPFTAALVQMTSGRVLDANLDTIERAVTDAANQGAALVCLPEVCTRMEMDREHLFAQLRDTDDDATVDRLRDMARRSGIWLSVGSHVAKRVVDGETKAANRSLLIGPDGGIAATYDKIHLFDVDLDGGESYRESNTYAGGERAVLVQTPLGGIGLTVCYDLRFPVLYRDLAMAGADILLIPSAFTRPTGQAHWETLLRARAIETGCFVLAAAQCGDHECGRKTWGHALAVDPWGEVLADAGTGPTTEFVQIDLARVTEARGRIPSLHNARRYAAP